MTESFVSGKKVVRLDDGNLLKLSGSTIAEQGPRDYSLEKKKNNARLHGFNTSESRWTSTGDPVHGPMGFGRAHGLRLQPLEADPALFPGPGRSTEAQPGCMPEPERVKKLGPPAA